MQLRCPHCRSLVRITDAMPRYFGMPVRCHEYARMFVVPPQNPLYDPALPADSVRPLDRSVSAARCFHKRVCRACRRKVRISGLERPAGGPVMRCSHCYVELGTSKARGIGTTPVILALVIVIIAGCGVLWLEHAGLIALRNLDTSRLLVTMKAGVGGWWVSLEQLKWHDWYNPPLE
ncbi:MAG: hypothetical protein VXX00_04075 [Pseudomonadota bacterium]|nr:hypothetical protein [Pseudomonadota bacterium]